MRNYEFGNMLTALRMEHGFSQFQLAHLIGVSDKAVSKWENGNVPKLKNCFRLSEILGIPVTDLLAASGDNKDAASDQQQKVAPIPEDVRSARMDHAPQKRVELHMRTNLSLADGMVDGRELSDRAAEWGMPAIASTDFCSTRAFPFLLSKGRKHSQKVILGCEVLMTASADAPVETAAHVMLLVQNRKGLVNLNKLVSLSYSKYYKGVPCTPREIIQEHHEGLLIGSSCDGGEVIDLLQRKASQEEMDACVSFYDYLEVQPIENELFIGIADNHQRAVLQDRVRKIIQIGVDHDIPVVAVSNGRYLDPEDSLSRAILQYVDGIEDADEQPPYYLRTTDEMLSCFAFLGEDVARTIVIDTTNHIASMVDDEIPLFPPEAVPGKTLLPEMPDAERHIKALAIQRAYQLYGSDLPDLIRKRLDKEFELISVQNSWAILEIAWLSVMFSLQEGYPVGFRGTTGGSLVAFLAGITCVNPLPPHYFCPGCHHIIFQSPDQSDCGADLPQKKCPVCGKQMDQDGFNVPVESFIGLDGNRQMNIDLNFSGEVQDKVQNYIRDYFGADHVFRSGTIIVFQKKNGEALASQYAASHHLDPESPSIRHAVDSISWSPRRFGQHPGGLYIVPQSYDINEFTSVQRMESHDLSSIPVSNYNWVVMHDILLKMDYLEHDNPTLLSLMHQKSGVAPESIPLHDEKVFSLFRSPLALGVKENDILLSTGVNGIPEFQTEYTQKILRKVQPTTLEELIRISGLSHGTDVWEDNVESLLSDEVASIYDCPATRDDITNYLTRHGVAFDKAFLFSENTRKGAAFRIDSDPEMITAFQRANIPEWFIKSCKKIKYLFPRGHAAAYVNDAVRIAWYKLYYPEAYYTSWFSVKNEDLEPTDIGMDIRSLRKAILSIQTELQPYTLDEKPYNSKLDSIVYEMVQEKWSRMATLRLLLEMKVRGYELSPDVLQQQNHASDNPPILMGS